MKCRHLEDLLREMKTSDGQGKKHRRRLQEESKSISHSTGRFTSILMLSPYLTLSLPSGLFGKEETEEKI
jgi:hypothetical protein